LLRNTDQRGLSMETRNMIELFSVLSRLASLPPREKGVKLKYAIALNIDALKDAFAVFDASKAEIVEKYGEDGVVSPDSDGYESAVAELEEIMSQEIDITPPSKIHLEWLDGVTSITERELMALAPVLEK